jgi:hypothetical protein
VSMEVALWLFFFPFHEDSVASAIMRDFESFRSRFGWRFSL